MAYSPNLQLLNLSGSGANNATASIATVIGTGPGFSVRYTGSLGTAVDSVSSVDVNGASSMLVQTGVTTTGTFRIEGTADGINYSTPEVFDGTNDLWVSSGSITPTLGNTYQILCANYRSIRLRTLTTLGAIVPHSWTLSMAQPILGGMDTGAAPHNFGYTLFHKDTTTSTTQTTVTFQTPTTGKRFAVTDITITAGGTTAGVVTLYDAAAGVAFSSGTTPAIIRVELAPSTTSRPGIVKQFPVPYVSTTVNNSILLTTSAAINPLYIQVNGYYI